MFMGPLFFLLNLELLYVSPTVYSLILWIGKTVSLFLAIHYQNLPRIYCICAWVIASIIINKLCIPLKKRKKYRVLTAFTMIIDPTCFVFALPLLFRDKAYDTGWKKITDGTALTLAIYFVDIFVIQIFIIYFGGEGTVDTWGCYKTKSWNYDTLYKISMDNEVPCNPEWSSNNNIYNKHQSTGTCQLPNVDCTQPRKKIHILYLLTSHTFSSIILTIWFIYIFWCVRQTYILSHKIK